MNDDRRAAQAKVTEKAAAVGVLVLLEHVAANPRTALAEVPAGQEPAVPVSQPGGADCHKR
jgi:hypothetical protein